MQAWQACTIKHSGPSLDSSRLARGAYQRRKGAFVKPGHRLLVKAKPPAPEDDDPVLMNKSGNPITARELLQQM